MSLYDVMYYYVINTCSFERQQRAQIQQARKGTPRYSGDCVNASAVADPL